MKVHPATEHDMAGIMALVTRTFAHEQGIPEEMIPIPAEKEPHWWCIRQDDNITAAVALYREGKEWHMGRLAVAPGLRGGHIATQLLETAIPAVFAMGIDTIYTDSRDTTVHILQKFGGEVAGETGVFFNGSITPVVLKRENLPARFHPAAHTDA